MLSDPINGKWHQTGQVTRRTYRCAYCELDVGPSIGYLAKLEQTGHSTAHIFICPQCNCPTLFTDKAQVPAPRFGRSVRGITDPAVLQAYEEARACTAALAFTAAVLLCRKILMNLAVSHGATPGSSFVAYVEYLDKAGYVPPNGKAWVDRIRIKGNEATHDIPQMSSADAEELLNFVEMLLRFSYEFRSLAP